MNDRTKIEELKVRVDEILYYLWDPIGISDEPCARGEYSSYVDSITEMVIEGKESKITDHLSMIEYQSMGLSRNNKRNREIAKRLIDDKIAIQEGLR